MSERRSLIQESLAAIERLKARLDASERAKHEPIAIIGAGCRYPGGIEDPELLWRVVRDGVDAVSDVPPDRWDVDAYYDPDPKAAGKMVTRRGGFLAQLDRFDAQFFGISPREATTMDPQQRLLLETAYEAIERAGLAADRLVGSNTGVFVGITTGDYGQLLRIGDPESSDVYSATGNALNAAAGRLSFVLGLQGPCAAVDTACSSSLVAVHLACQSLRSGECDLALAGGVNVILSPNAMVLFSKWGMMAPDGACKTFDATADGFVRGEGCAVIALKRLSDALAAHDPILAVIRGSAVNSDGRSSGLTVPNGLAQQMVLRKALANAGLTPADVDYVEAHGTGTSLGDPIEVEALGAVMGKGRPSDRPLLVGSIKTNLGHTEAASGLAGLLKVVMALVHEFVPPHLHFSAPNLEFHGRTFKSKCQQRSRCGPAAKARAAPALALSDLAARMPISSSRKRRCSLRMPCRRLLGQCSFHCQPAMTRHCENCRCDMRTFWLPARRCHWEMWPRPLARAARIWRGGWRSLPAPLTICNATCACLRQGKHREEPSKEQFGLETSRKLPSSLPAKARNTGAWGAGFTTLNQSFERCWIMPPEFSRLIFPGHYCRCSTLGKGTQPS